MDLVEGLPGESALLRRELVRISDRRFARRRVHPPEGALRLMCAQGSLSSIRRFGDTRPELLAGLDLRRIPAVAALSRLPQRHSSSRRQDRGLAVSDYPGHCSGKDCQREHHREGRLITAGQVEYHGTTQRAKAAGNLVDH